MAASIPTEAKYSARVSNTHKLMRLPRGLREAGEPDCRCSRITVRIGRRIAPLQMDLVQPILLGLQKKVFINGQSPIRICIEFHHPTAHSFRIELFIPGGVK